MTGTGILNGGSQNLSLAAALAKLDLIVRQGNLVPEAFAPKSVYDYDFPLIGVAEPKEVPPIPQLRHQARINMSQKQHAMKSKSRR